MNVRELGKREQNAELCFSAPADHASMLKFSRVIESELALPKGNWGDLGEYYD